MRLNAAGHEQEYRAVLQNLIYGQEATPGTHLGLYSFNETTLELMWADPPDRANMADMSEEMTWRKNYLIVFTS